MGKMGDGPDGSCSCEGICNGCASDACDEVWLCGDSDDDCVTRVPARDRIIGDPVGDWMIVGVLSPGVCWIILICSSLMCWESSGRSMSFWGGSLTDVSIALSNDSFIDDSASRCFCSSSCCCR